MSKHTVIVETTSGTVEIEGVVALTTIDQLLTIEYEVRVPGESYFNAFKRFSGSEWSRYEYIADPG